MAPKGSDRRSHPPESTLTFENMRKAVVDRKLNSIKNVVAEREQDLIRLQLLLHDKAHVGCWQAGWDKDRVIPGHDSPSQAEVDAFVQANKDQHAIESLDLSIPELGPTPPPSPKQPSQPAHTDSAPAAEDVEMKEDTPAEVKPDGPVTAASGTATPAGPSSELAVPTVVVDRSTPGLATPADNLSSAAQSPAPTPSATKTPAPALPRLNIPTASTSTLPNTISPSALTFAPLNPADRAHIPPPFASAFPIPQLSADYASTLPSLPAEVGRARLAPSSLRRKGKGKEPAGPDLYRMHAKAKHTGASNFLGRGKRVHNVLTTHDWGVGLEELRAQRAFDLIEQLKADKAWSFRQPKKQRAGMVPKAHWDHLIDEMKWMQTDFRQETRWQKVTAYHMARAVKAWHKATPEERAELVVKTREPTFLSLAGEGEEDEVVKAEDEVEEGAAGGEMEVDADGDEDAEGEEDDADGEAEGAADDKAGAAPGAAPTAGAADPPKPTPTPNEPTELQKASKAAQHIQNLIASRAPVFELGIGATLVDPLKLSHMEDPSIATNLGSLFPDLPLYSDFLLANEPQGDKRVDEASIFAGRLSHVSRLLESKPLLVSTIQPSRTKTKEGWVPGASVMLEDGKEVAEAHELPPSQSQLFAGRKARDLNQPELGSRPPQVSNPDQRAASLHWAPEDDQLLLQLVGQYGSNWGLVAETFNGAATRPACDHRLAWDLFDRWDKLAGPGSRKVLADGTEVAVPLPEYQPAQDRLGLAPQFANFAGPKKRLRHLTVFDAMRKVQKKREATAAKQPPPGPPRRVNMTMHDSHNLPPRPLFTPMEWASVRVENDAKLRARQEEMRLRMAAQQQQQQQHQQAQALANQQAQQQQQQGQQGQQQQLQQQQQYRQQSVPQGGFPIQQQRIVSGGQQSPHLANQLPPNTNVAAQLAALQQQQQQGNTPLTPEQINLYRAYQAQYQQQQAQQQAQQAQAQQAQQQR